MSLIVSAYVNDGFVLASDSRGTYEDTNPAAPSCFPFSDNIQKTFVTKSNYGISICGAASVGDAPIAGYIKSFIEKSDCEKSTTVLDFANKFMLTISSLGIKGSFIAHIAGYDEFTPHLYRCVFHSNKIQNIVDCISDGKPNFIWNGVTETVSRLVKPQLLSDSIRLMPEVSISENGKTTILKNVYIANQNDSFYTQKAQIKINYYTLQDAVDFCRFVIRTTIGAQRFISEAKTVGGPIDVLVIKPHQAIWLSHKGLK